MNCLLCGTKFTKNKMCRRERKYCSDECRKRHFNQKASLTRKPVASPKKSGRKPNFGWLYQQCGRGT